MANRMTDLIDKVERRLGTKPLNLPDNIKKDKWGTIIVKDTITTFSRYFPHKFTILIDTSRQKDGYYIIDDAVCESLDILGIRDINWHQFSHNSPTLQLGGGYGIYDSIAGDYSVDDVGLLQMRADHTSLFNNGIYLDFQPPNKVRAITTTGGNVLNGIANFPIDLLVKHPDNLMTISPTMMETFERLAISDIAVFLFEYLKYYDGLETVFANVDLKLSTLEARANERLDIVQKLEESYVSAANTNQPVMYTV